jgi:hypothetical protein
MYVLKIHRLRQFDAFLDRNKAHISNVNVDQIRPTVISDASVCMDVKHLKSHGLNAPKS